MDEMHDEGFMPEEERGSELPPRGLPDPTSPRVGAAQDPFSIRAPGAPEPSEDVPEDMIIAYQEDLVARSLQMISDTNDKGAGAPADAILRRMNVKGMEAPAAIGGTAAQVVTTITNMAKRQGVEYPGMSVLLGGIEVVEALVDLSKSAGIFPQIPEKEEDPETHEQMVLTASLEAAKAYGEHMMRTGQVNQKEFAEALDQAMEEEAMNGELDDWDPGQMMTPQAMRDLMHRGVTGAGQNKGPQPPSNTPFMMDEGLA